MIGTHGLGRSTIEGVCGEGGHSINLEGEWPTECHVLIHKDSVLCDAALCRTITETCEGCGAGFNKDYTYSNSTYSLFESSYECSFGTLELVKTPVGADAIK